MQNFKKIVFGVLISVLLFSTSISFAILEDSINQIEDKESDLYIEKLYSQYKDVWKIEFISKDENNFFYFRIFEKSSSRNYFIVEYNNDLSKTKELIWIWSKKYDAEIRDIRFANETENTADAKVYLRNSKVIDEKIIFIDNPTEKEKLHFIEK